MIQKIKRGTQSIGKIEHLSASTINSMKTCAKAVYFQKIKGIPNKTQYSKTVFGLAIHHALEYWGNCKIGGFPVRLKDVIEEFHKYFDEHYSEITIWGTDTPMQLKIQGENALQLFFTKFKGQLKPKLVETQFIIDRGKNSLPVLGYIDLLTTDGCIYDYKCGKSSVASRYIGNMSCYAWSYLIKHGSLPKEVATIAIKWRQKNKQDYVTDWEKHIIPIDMEYIEYIKQECIDVEKMIKAECFPRAESSCGLCKNCGYKKLCGMVVLK